MMDFDYPPKYCRCTPSSVAHLRGCWEGWGEPVQKRECEYEDLICNGCKTNVDIKCVCECHQPLRDEVQENLDKERIRTLGG